MISTIPSVQSTSEFSVRGAGQAVRDASVQARRASEARKLQSTKRKKIDPTTCERDYSASELEFMNAMQAYKQRNGRPFPTWSEVLEVVRGLGYEKA